MVPYLSRIEGPPPKKKADYRLFWKLKTGQPRTLIRIAINPQHLIRRSESAGGKMSYRQS